MIVVRVEVEERGGNDYHAVTCTVQDHSANQCWR